MCPGLGAVDCQAWWGEACVCWFWVPVLPRDFLTWLRLPCPLALGCGAQSGCTGMAGTCQPQAGAQWGCLRSLAHQAGAQKPERLSPVPGALEPRTRTLSVPVRS